LSPIPALVVRLVKGSLLFFPVLTGLFWLGTSLGFWGSMCLAFLLELLPALAVAQLPIAYEEEPLPRLPVYLTSAAIILAVGGLAFVVGRGELGMEAMGLRSPGVGPLVVWTSVLVVASLALLFGFLFLRKRMGIRETPVLGQLLPDTPMEKVVFVLLSASAGVGEEMAYRGFLIPVLAMVMGSGWGAVLLSSAAFGLLHAYQGWLGIGRTSVIGVVYGTAFFLSGTLWPAVLAHAILDLVAGILVGDALVKD
jgi:hypothetical protein